jgi:chemotaxis protein CheD
VAIVLHDVEARVGGLAHVLLPSAQMSRDRTNPAKFPETAIPTLIADMRRLGAKQERLTARIVGGASMFGNLLPARGINIGERNIAAVRTVLATERVPIVGEDVGSDYGRSVYLSVEDGRVEVRSLRMGTRAL